MNILYVVPYTPTPIRTRPYNLIRSLASLGHQITLATVWENEVEKQSLNTMVESGVKVIAEQLTRVQQVINMSQAWFTGTPLQFRYSWQPELANKVVTQAKQLHNNCDIIHIEHFRGAIYGIKLKSEIAERPNRQPIIWDSVDNISLLFEQAIQRSKSLFGRWVTQLELPRTRRYERYLVSQFDRTLVTSPIDLKAFEQLTNHPNESIRLELLTNGVDLEYFSPSTERRQPDTIVFSGKLSYHANLSGAIYLIKDIMPIVWEKRPEVKVQLVGKDPPKVLQSFAKENRRIEVTGTVEDIRPYLRQATLTAATITYGVGVQNKVLESMACGTPVVATPQAVSALRVNQNQDILVGNSPSELATAMLQLLEDSSLNKSVGMNGLKYVINHHNWNTIANKLAKIYEDNIYTNGSSERGKPIISS